jgi:hypothetical protein
VVGNIAFIFMSKFKKTGFMTFLDHVEVHITEGVLVKPDVAVIGNPEIIKTDAIYGAPD